MSSRATVNARVNIVYRLLCLGMDTGKIYEYVANRYGLWHAATRTVDRYIARAKVLMEEAGQCERPVELGRAMARLNDLYQRSLTEKDRRTELDVIRTIIDMRGLKAPVQIDIASERERLVELMCEDVMREATAATAGASDSD